MDGTSVFKHGGNSDRAYNMKNGVKGKHLKDVKDEEFSRDRYVCIIVWSHVCSSTCFNPIAYGGGGRGAAFWPVPSDWQSEL